MKRRRIGMGMAALFGLGLALVLAGCAGSPKLLQSPVLSLGEARVTAMSLTDMQLEFDVDVKNPNPIGLSLQGLSYTLQVQDQPLVRGALQERLHVDARGAARVRLPLALRFEDIYGTLLALRDQRELHYRLSGEADFGLLRLPYEKSGTIALPSLPAISVDSVRVDQLGLGGLELTVVLAVDNANRFPIRLDGLDYQFTLGDTALVRGASRAPLAVPGQHQGRLALALSLRYDQIGALVQQLRSASSLPVAFSSQVRLPGLHGSTVVPYDWQGRVPLTR